MASIMREILRTISVTWRGRVLAVLGIVLLTATLVLAYKAGQMRLLG